jgi:multidrug transporter EmrE-like cation transporter
MFQRLRSFPLPITQGHTPLIVGLLLLNMVFNILDNSSFKQSALEANWKGFLSWQVASNLAGLVTVLTLTGLLRYLPLHVAQPMVQGLAIIGMQIVASHLFFHEAISPTQ